MFFCLKALKYYLKCVTICNVKVICGINTAYIFRSADPQSATLTEFEEIL